VLTQAIGNLLPAAVGVALSPIPIVAVVLVLGTARARANGPAFAVGWVAGLVVVSVVVLLVAGGADDPDSTAATSVNWVQVGVGVLFLAMARRQWRARPKEGETPEMPTWMASLDRIHPGRSLLLGVALSAVNPKNLVLTAAGAAAIAQAGLSTGDTVVAVVVFVAVASSTVVGAVLFSLVGGDRASGALSTVKDFMARNNAVIMMVLLLVLGAKLIGDGLGGFGR
jgi:threonine/homoserine/homoserine lactone efflux protein